MPHDEEGCSSFIKYIGFECEFWRVWNPTQIPEFGFGFKLVGRLFIEKWTVWLDYLLSDIEEHDHMWWLRVVQAPQLETYRQIDSQTLGFSHRQIYVWQHLTDLKLRGSRSPGFTLATMPCYYKWYTLKVWVCEWVSDSPWSCCQVNKIKAKSYDSLSLENL